MNYFELLEIEPTKNEEAIRRAYLIAVKKYHPDVFAGDKTFAENRCAEINKAYLVLKNERLRNDYITSNNLICVDVKDKIQKEQKAEEIEAKPAKIDIKKEKKVFIKEFFKTRYAGEDKGKLVIDIILFSLIATLIILMII